MADDEDGGGGGGRENFNRGMIQPSLLDQLKGILNQYPDDGQILKELIQNADDAGATEIKFMLDSTHYPTHSPTDQLFSGDMDQYQGPALLAFNNACFSEDDWKGIRMMCDSVKKTDALKVGRFGLGFKSVFHITDVPSVVSGSGVGFIDPHEKLFRRERTKGRPTSAYKWDMKEHSADMAEIPQQWAPYKHRLFHLDDETFKRKRDYPYTLFRFPLRPQSHDSELAGAYSEEKLKALFHSLRLEGHLHLLFLHQLESIELYKKAEKDGDKDTLLYRVCISPNCLENVRQHRAEVKKKMAAVGTSHKNGAKKEDACSQSQTYNLQLEVWDGEQEKICEYLVCQYCATSRPEDLSQHLPLVGAALALHDNDLPTMKQNNNNQGQGHLFCFLPLPLEKTSPTGLNVHVNGYFGVEQNRRHIKWPTADQDKVTDRTLLWNLHLLKELLPSALVALVCHAAENMGGRNALTRAQYISLFPDEDCVATQWRPLVHAFYRQVAAHPVFLAAQGHKVVKSQDAMFCCHDDPLGELLCRILAENNVNACMLPKHIIDGVIRHSGPEKIRRVSSAKEDLATALLHVQDRIELTDKERSDLLTYIDPKYLHGLQLLPVGNGSWVKFQQHSHYGTVEKVYIPNNDFPADLLLPNQANRFVASNLPQDVQDRLRSIAQQGLYQVCLFNRSSATEEVRGIFKNHVSEEIVIRKPDSMSKDWFQKVWRFLNNYHQDLSSFEGLPLIPLSDNQQLCHLSTSQPIMHNNRNALSATLLEILKQLGVIVIPGIPDFVQQHASIKNYVHSSSQLATILILLHRYLESGYTSLSSRVGDLEVNQKQKLQSAITGLSHNDRQSLLHILRSLPLCETIEGSGHMNSDFVSAEEVPFTGPNVTFPIKIPQRLLQPNRFTEILQVPEKKVADILIDMMASRLTQQDKEKVAKMALNKLDDYKRQNGNFSYHLSEFDFVSTHQGRHVKPCELVSPSSPKLRELLQEIDAIPAGEFSDRKYQVNMEQVGLRQTPTADELYKVAKRIGELSTNENPTVAHAKSLQLAKNLLGFFEQSQDILNQQVRCTFTTLKQSINHINWVPVVQERLSSYPSSLPWAGETQHTVAPNYAVAVKHGLFCGSVKIIMPASSVLPTEQPSVKSVVRHLQQCTSHYTPGTEDMAFLNVVMAVYSYLRTQSVREVLDEMQQVGLTDWIWKGDGFTSADRIVARSSAISVVPYMYTLPSECHSVKDLFMNCGMQEECSYVEVLRRMKLKHDNEGQNLNAMETARDLQMAVSILDQLSRDGSCHHHEDILLPVHSTETQLKLLPIAECVYCDDAWHQRGIDVNDMGDEDEDSGDIRFSVLHRDIAQETARRLGVDNIMSRLLDGENLDISYGQSESLVDRISSLLKEYRDGLAILKELIQNADDAGATEVKFVYDERENKAHRVTLFDSTMKELQGPALWAYNDKQFTEEDFKNIVKLGGKTKETITNKIGKFGLGFNAVYNLTDVPSFISGSNIVFFDPHTSYLGAALPNKANPGIKYDLSKRLIRKRMQHLPDQFHPFNDVLGCDLTSSAQEIGYKGTLFRFPLRTATQADTSKLCSIHYTKQEVLKLLKLLHENRHTLLLFTQTVCKVSVHHIAAAATSAREMTDVFSIVRCTHKNQGLVIPEPGYVPVTQVLQAASEAKKRQNQEELSATYVIENKCTTDARQTLLQNCASTQHDDTKLFLVSSKISGGSASDMARSSADLVPVAGVAWELDVTGHNTKREETQVYCFMALPITSPYPVHVNGYFSVTANRTHLSMKDIHDKQDNGAVWNQHLIQDAVCGAYISLLKTLSQQPNSAETSPYSLWPKSHSGDHAKLFNSLEKSFYERLLSKDGPALFSSSKGWRSFKDCFFLESSYRRSKLGDTVFGVLADHFDGAVVDVTESVYKLILKYGSFDHTQVITEEKFLKDVLLPNEIDEAKRTALLIDALLRAGKNKSGPVWGMLSEVPWVPTKPSGQPKIPRDLIDPDGQLKDLYSDEDERFPLWTAANIRETCVTYSLDTAEEVMVYAAGYLRELGMKRDLIPWNEVLERAKTVSNLDRTEGVRRVTCLVSLIERLAAKEAPTEEQLSVLHNIRFLPAAEKPAGYPLAWDKDRTGVVWVTCSESHLMSLRYLLGSVMPLVEEQIFPYKYRGSDAVYEVLGLKGKSIPLGLVLQQVDAMMEKNMSGIDTVETQEMKKILRAVCENLEAHIKNDGDKKTLQILKDKRFLLQEGMNQFVSAKEVAHKLQHHCEPYLFEVSATQKRNFPRLLDFLGVKETFSASDFIDVLKRIYEKYQSNPISKEELGVVCNIAKLLYMLKDETEASHCQAMNKPIYLPNQAGILQVSTGLCYNDCEWISTDTSMQFCHEDIPQAQADFLGVKNKRRARLSHHQHGISFGQKEKLTNRLHRLLAGYPFGIEILKELLQNADDAGAKKIHFILDPRTHKGSRVFDEGWKELQGPALLVYNDKPFTKKDLEGIQNLGEGSKSNDAHKAGKYGVGFNCVYNLTDTPTFLTTVKGEGKCLCAFDPHCKNVPGASLENPGQMFEVNESLEQTFPDVFSCYLSDKDGLSPEDGTMFRLPLRTPEMAGESKISSKAVTPQDMEKLFNEFKPQLAEMLLFINSVEEIILSTVDPKTGDIKTVCQVHAELSEEDIRLRSDFHHNVKQAMSQVKSGDIQLGDVEQREILYNMPIRKSDQPSDEWIIVQKFGVDSSDDIPQNVLQASHGDLCPLGGVAYKKKQAHHATLSTRPSQNKLFCFLPLPVRTDLPVHVNGNFALSSETRHDLLMDSRSHLSEWNEMLFRAVIAPAYVSLLKHQQQETKRKLDGDQQQSNADQKLQTYFSAFPSVPGEEKLQTMKDQFALRKAVYELIKHLSLFPMMDKQTRDTSWHPVIPVDENHGNKTYFDTLDKQMRSKSLTNLSMSLGMYRGEPEPPKHEKLSTILRRCGMILIDAPQVILENCQASDVPAIEVSPSAVVEFLKQPHCLLKNLPCSLHNTPLGDAQSLVILCKYLKKEQDLKDLPIVLTRDEKLRRMEQPPTVYHTDHYEAVPTVKDCILHPHLLSIMPQGAFKTLTLADFAEMLGRIEMLPPKFKGKGARPEVTSLPNTFPKDWLIKVWRFIEEEIGKKGANVDLGRVLGPILEWALVPCKHRGENLLYPVGNANALLDTEQGDQFSESLRSSLKKLPIARPDYEMLTTRALLYSKLEAPSLTSMVAIINNPYNLLWALGNVKKDIVDTNVSFEQNERMKLLQYFESHLGKLCEVPEYIDTLRCLPIFTTVTGHQVSLEGKCAYTLPQGVPTDDMDAFHSTKDFVFLWGDAELEKLYEKIGCLCLKIEDFYCQFVFKQFDLMTDKGRLKHLEFLRDQLTAEKNCLQHRGDLIACLKDLPIMKDQTTRDLKLASSFYDPHVTVFKHLVPRKDLPPEPFHLYTWREFLVQIGMISVVTEEHIVRFCKCLEAIGSTQTTPNPLDSISTKAEVIVEFLFSTMTPSGSMLSKIKDIKFLPSANVRDREVFLPRLAEKQGTLQCFEGSAFASDEGYVWSCVPVIPEKFHPRMFVPRQVKVKKRDNCIKTVLSLLGVLSPVPIAMVATHANKVCRAAEEKLHVTGKTADRLHLYAALTRILGKIFDQFRREQLPFQQLVENLCIIPVKREESRVYFANALQVVTKDIRETDEIPPYLFSMPSDLGQFADVFLKMGAQEKASVDTYARVLNQIHDDSSSNQGILSPDEIEAVLKSYGQLCYIASQSTSDLKFQETELYLPGQDKKLHAARKLVVNDLPSVVKRVTDFREVFLVIPEDDNSTRITFLLQGFPLELRPKPLSSLVHEKTEDNLETHEGPSAEADRLRDRLDSPEFFHGLCRLIAHIKTISSRGQQDMGQEDIDKVRETLEAVQVTTVYRLKTHLLYQNKIVQNSEQLKDLHVSKNGDQLKVYFHHGQRVDDATIGKKLAQSFTRVFGLENERYTEWLFTHPVDKIDQAFDDEDITRLGSTHTAFAPRCGETVALALHHMLVPRIEELREGQWVGVLRHDPQDDGEEAEPVYIIGKVIHQVNPEEQDLTKRKYIVQTGQRAEEVIEIVKLYSFYRENHAASDEADVPLERSVADIKHEVTQQLEAAYSLPGNLGRQLGRRLLEVYDPSDTPRLQEVYEHLKNEMKRHEQQAVSGALDSGGGDRGLGAPATYHGSDACFEYLRSRSRAHRKKTQQFNDNVSKQKAIDGFYVPKKRPGRNPQPGEASLWIRQAIHDINSAANDCSDSSSQFLEWVCFKCHQAAEKALRGAQVSVDSSEPHTKHLPTACIENEHLRDDDQLYKDAVELQNIVGEEMWYPRYGMTPHARFTESQALRAKQLARNILEKAQALYNQNRW